MLVLSGMFTYDAVAIFGDSELNSSNTITTAISWGQTTLFYDSFEGNPWDASWDGNGDTAWNHSSERSHSGTHSALSEKGAKNEFTTDDIDASVTDRWIRISFWYYPESLGHGDIIVEFYKSSTQQYLEWYDIHDHSSYQSDTWCYFDEYITDPDYFASNFRLRFDSAINSAGQDFYLDDVLIAVMAVS
jgi:hypothetical protein